MHHVTVSVNDTVMGSVSGGGDYALNSTVTLIATPKSGYSFLQWDDSTTQNPRTVTILSDTSFMAEFSVYIPSIYHVTVLAHNPSMGSVSGEGDYVEDTVITISATPYTGYSFLQWHDGNTDNPRSITVTQDMSFTAIFIVIAQETYYVSLTANNPTMGSLSGEGEYPKDTIITISATPYTGYRFIQWDDGNTDNPRSVTVMQDTSFTAIFGVIAPGMYYVLVTANNSSMGNVSGEGIIPKILSLPLAQRLIQAIFLSSGMTAIPTIRVV
jgi:hypothetical protein